MLFSQVSPFQHICTVLCTCNREKPLKPPYKFPYNTLDNGKSGDAGHRSCFVLLFAKNNVLFLTIINVSSSAKFEASKN